MKFETGQTVGDYEFIDVLESSSTGVAYKVRNVLAQRFELLKILPKSLQDNREREERFVREIKLHARLVHPNIAMFYNATQIEGQMVMTTELVEGVTLAERFELGPMPPADAVALLSQALSALQYAHEAGVIHREVTPANMIVTPEGTIKLTGFGLAKSISDPQLTQMGTMMGSLYYMAPEQVKGAAADARSDIYALGVVLYEAVTGKVPFEATSQFDIMLAHVSSEPKAPSQVNPRLTPELDAIILKALAKDPSQRFQTAAEFRDALLGNMAVAAAVDIKVNGQLRAENGKSVAEPVASTLAGLAGVAYPPAPAVPHAPAGLVSSAGPGEVRHIQPVVRLSPPHVPRSSEPPEEKPARWSTPELMVALVTIIIAVLAFFALVSMSKS
jgi:serine/threonine-protein kinase